MSIKEVIELQDATKRLYLLRQGLFYRGYNQAAAFLAETFGYRLFRKEIKTCGKQVFYVGFPAISKSKICEAVRQQGGTLEQDDNGCMVISGIERTYNEAALLGGVSTPRVRQPTKQRSSESSSENLRSVANEIMGFDLMRSTPMECLAFLSALQKRLKIEN